LPAVFPFSPENWQPIAGPSQGGKDSLNIGGNTTSVQSFGIPIGHHTIIVEIVRFMLEDSSDADPWLIPSSQSNAQLPFAASYTFSRAPQKRPAPVTKWLFSDLPMPASPINPFPHGPQP
jgi:hypothetical protein